MDIIKLNPIVLEDRFKQTENYFKTEDFIYEIKFLARLDLWAGR